MIGRRIDMIAKVAIFAAVLLVGLSAAQDKEKKQKYVGAQTCKNCHSAKVAGEQFKKWSEWQMSKTYETLATDKAKEMAKKQGIDDPQKSEKCLKCHVTAFGVDEKQFDKKFDAKMGIQCEACHGPAEKHVKNRLAAAGEEDDATQHTKAQKEMPLPTKEVCVKCHNEESPAADESPFWDKEKKEFLFEKAWKSIKHHNPKYHKDEKDDK